MPLLMFVGLSGVFLGWSIPLIEDFIQKYYGWIFIHSPATICLIGFIFGLAALVFGLFASISLEEK